MWAALLFVLLLGYASAENGWKASTLYKYQVSARTLTGIHQVKDQYSGVIIKALLTIQTSTDNRLTLQVSNSRYADVHSNFTGGWSSEVSDSEVDYKKLPFENKPFLVDLKNGVVESLVVDQSITTLEVNFIKSIVSQLQVDTRAENIKKSNGNLLPEDGKPFAVYKTLEDSINGIYETTYEVSPLPAYILQSRQELVPLPHLRSDGDFINIVKTRNFSKGKQHVVYHFGANGNEDWKAGSNRMGNVLSRSSVSRVVISGNLDSYTIHSSVTDEKVIVAPHLHNPQKGIVVGRVNLTLQEVTPSEGPFPKVEKPRIFSNLVYEYSDGHEGEQGESSEEQNAIESSETPTESSEDKQNASVSEKEEPEGDERRFGPKNSKRRGPVRSRLVSGDDEGSYSSASSEGTSGEFLPSQPDLHQAPRIEFLPDYVDFNRVNISVQIKRLAEQVGRWIENPSGVPQEHKLSYFALLTGLVARASSQDLLQLTELLYYPVSKVENQGKDVYHSYQTWVAFRDSVSQAGTGPALVTIRNWIGTGNIQGEEAAEVVAVLAESVRYPTTQYMNYFFETTKSEAVKSQKYLNTSALLSFTDLVRRSQVDKESASNRYSIHLFGKSGESHQSVVGESYIPYLGRQLEKAVVKKDSVKIQLYIRALGNTGHPAILLVLKPYLEGEKNVTHFQRFAIVASLDRMIRVHPKLAQNVLYRIYQNQGEAAEIRVAAVMQLMKTNPSAKMLLRMAEMTNHDHSKQVNSAVKMAIESAAASGHSLGHPELVRNAQAALNVIHPDVYGLQFSKNYLRSYVLSQQEQLSYHIHVTNVQGQDSVIPKAVFYQLERNRGGFRRSPFSAFVMTSSADQLLDMLSVQHASAPENSKHHHSKNQQGRKNSGYTFKKIKKLLNLKSDEHEQLEGQFGLPLFGGNRFFTFDNNTMKQLPKVIGEYYDKLIKGVNVHHTKFYNQYSLEVGFPLVTGLPFTYSLHVPTLTSFIGQLKGQSSTRQSNGRQSLFSTAFTADIQFTYSVQKRGQLGFVAPFSNQKYISGLNKNVFIHIPLKGELDYNTNNSTVQIQLQPSTDVKQKQQIFQLSDTVFTTVQSNDEVIPRLEGTNAKPVHVKPIKVYNETIGLEETGHALEIEETTELKHHKQEKHRKHDLLSYFVFADTDETIANRNLSVSYNPLRSTSNKIRIILSHTSSRNQSRSGSNRRMSPKMNTGRGDNVALPSSYESRREQLLDNVMSGIEDADGHVVDGRISFGGQDDSGYSITLALASSPVSEKSRTLVYYNGKPVQTLDNSKHYQAGFELTVDNPLLPVLSFKDAISSKPSAFVEGKLDLVQGSRPAGKVVLKGELNRSTQRKEFLLNYSLSKQCIAQMEEGNYIQPACRNATVNAYYLDKYDLTVKYQDLPENLTNAIYKAYRHAYQMGREYAEENVFNVTNPRGTVWVGVNFTLPRVNVSLSAPTFNTVLKDVRLSQLAIPLLAYNAKYNQKDLLLQKLYQSQPTFTAVVDGNTVTTFNNRTYPIELGDCYHVFAMHSPRSRQGQNCKSRTNKNHQRNFAVLVKETDPQHKDVRVVIGDDQVSLQHSSSGGVKVIANNQDVVVKENKLSRFSVNGSTADVHSLPGKSVVVRFPENGLELVYDGTKVQLTLSHEYKNKVRGLAGTFDDELWEDFTLPNNKVAGNHSMFADSYALIDCECRGPSKDRHQNVSRIPSFDKTITPGVAVSESEAGYTDNNKISNIKTNLIKAERHDCRVLEKLWIINPGLSKCETFDYQWTCGPKCKPTRLIQKPVLFMCEKSRYTTMAIYLPEGCVPR